eukprot:CAMPEP_0181196320 /NCGR_PEP_ID=MMETSP1096-20121128/15397_1 /TAXON_ID=156174 ORGANISM="Chrysochromulina ericina, Strain CCMP281" /NCGR_SAMPLE_ID=MMETSP1096 /ASSEMBLY_ACC=CAM_ASM_000453 /LENGTH=81 /DNA_ID=CAMNT_0023286061 /DNA_START=1224 /DNA_END=1472 /DNA_ORIENTATION=+
MAPQTRAVSTTRKVAPAPIVVRLSRLLLGAPAMSSAARGFAKPHAAAAMVGVALSWPLCNVSERPTCVRSGSLASEQNSFW